jgi:hypothetical protein
MPTFDGFSVQQLAICVDFDGPIHAYRRGWHDGTIYDEVVPGVAAALFALQRLGFWIIIHTSRVSPLPGTESEPAGHVGRRVELVEDWLRRQGVPFDEVWSGHGKPCAVAYVDDRAVPFIPQQGWPGALANLIFGLQSAGLLSAETSSANPEHPDRRAGVEERASVSGPRIVVPDGNDAPDGEGGGTPG